MVYLAAINIDYEVDEYFMNMNEIQIKNILRWSLIVICGVVLFAQSAIIVRIISEIPYLLDISGNEEKIFTVLLVVFGFPMMFLATIAFFYISNLQLLFWLSWEIVWGYILFLTYKNRMVWRLKSQIISHVILASSALIPFILWVILVTPEKPGLPSIYDIQILDPFYSIQVCFCRCLRS